jgi:hypothetical protein
MGIKVVEISHQQAEKIILMNNYPHFLAPISIGEKIYIETKYLNYPYFSKQSQYLEPYKLGEIEIEVPEID